MDASPSDSPRHRICQAIEEVGRSLRFLSRLGCSGFDCTQKNVDTVMGWGTRGPALRETLTDIRRDLGDCRRCALAGHRTRIVFGAGDPNARLVFVGEGPGQEEDRQGEPFVGPAGQLLTRIIEAIRFRRDRVYICNVVKCRPPGNRNPLPEEIGSCRSFLERQIEAVDPQYICTLGTVAAQTLLASELPISRLRGTFHAVDGRKILPTYHPAFLLRNPEKKREVWEDMKKLMRDMDQNPWNRK